MRSFEEDSQLFDATLQHLASRDRRLLTFSSEESDRQRKVDLAHEALIFSWPTFQQWISQLRKAEKIRRRLQEKAQDWIRLEKIINGSKFHFSPYDDKIVVSDENDGSIKVWSKELLEFNPEKTLDNYNSKDKPPTPESF